MFWGLHFNKTSDWRPAVLLKREFGISAFLRNSQKYTNSDLERYTNADLEISLYARVYMKIIP